MSKRIQGITVEIGGDTTKLTTALKNVNGEIRNTQAQLKDVEKLLKLDPSNTELLSQKQRLLNEAVVETKEKLDALKNASEQANAALENGTITKEQYDGLQREIIETENALERLELQAKESATAIQKIANAGSGMQSLGSSIEGVGKAVMPASVAVTGIGVAGIKVATDFEKAMSSVQAITGATGDDFERLRNTAIDLGATTAFSAGEVAEAMTEMAKAGWSTTQIIDGMAGVLDATAASGEGLGSVATIVADAITGFGMEAKDSARVADLLTQAANSGTIGITDLGESYKYVAPMAQSMGLSIEDVTAAISAMSMAGIKGSQAGTSLRTMLANLTKPSESVGKAIVALGIEITNTDGTFKSLDEIIAILRTSFTGLTDEEKAYYAAALAGKEGMSGLISILNLTQSEYDALTLSMNNCTGVAGQTASVMQDNMQSKVEQLGGALESLAIKLADYVIPFITSMTEKLTSMIEAFTNLNPNVQQAILVIGGIVAVAGPVLIVVGKIISSVGTILTLLPKLAGFISTVKTAFMALNTTMLANPIMLIIAAIAALVAAFIYLWNNCDGFRQFWIDLWAKIKDVFSNMKEYITGFAKNAVEWGKDLVMGLVNGIKSCIGAVGDAVKSVADKIKSFLHFSVPDEGPLTEYESWMPAFMKGLAKGIEKSKGLVADAVDGVAADMVISPNVTAGSIQAAQLEQRDAFSGILTGIQNAVGALQNTQQNTGNISIPVYIGGTLLDEVVVNAQNRQNLRSGGR